MNAPLQFNGRYPMQRFGAMLFAREQESPQYGNLDSDGEPETTSDWNRVHQRITELAAERAKHEREVCRWLLAAERLGVHLRAGYANLAEYSARTLGLSGRQTEERLRVGRALVDLPRLDAALGAGQFCWSVVRELSRVAVADTEQAWVDWAKGMGARAIERAVAGRLPGDGPEDRADPARVKHRLSFEVRPETLALFRDLQARVQGDLGEKVDDDTLLFELARRALAGPGDDGRASYQVAVSRCDACGLTPSMPAERASWSMKRSPQWPSATGSTSARWWRTPTWGRPRRAPSSPPSAPLSPSRRRAFLREALKRV